MCKVLMLTNTEKLKNRKTVVESIAKHLLTDQRDGFGYAIQGAQGAYGERTIKDEFTSRIGNEKHEIKDAIFQPTYNRYGTIAKPVGGAIFHGRTSTNSLGLVNTHPIVKNNWSLIHNGVVTNHGPKYEKETSNDTEDLVHYLSTTGVSGIEEHITGYYAIGALDPMGNLHIIKDAVAPLFVCINKTLECFMFATTERLLTEVAKDCHWALGPLEEVRDNCHLIYDIKGKLIHNQDIKSRGYGFKESEYSKFSLGRDLREVGAYEGYDADVMWAKYKVDSERSEFKGYKFFDWNDKELTYDEFIMLDVVTKADCFVYRPDGSLVEPEDYFSERIS